MQRVRYLGNGAGGNGIALRSPLSARYRQNVAQALDIADRAYSMASGQIVGAGSAAEMRTEGALEAAYLGEA